MSNSNGSTSGLSSTLPRIVGFLVLSVATWLLVGCATVIAEPSGASSSATTPVAPAVSLAFTAQPSATAQSATIAPVQITIRNASGGTVATATNTVTLKLASGSGLTGTLTAVAVNGVAQFSNLSATALGTYTLVASSPGLSSATSQSFQITIPTTPHLAVASDAVVDSVGITVHLAYTNTPYSNFPAVEAALVDLGIRHLRDGVIPSPPSFYAPEHNLLGQLGFETIFITSVGQSAALLKSYPALMAQCFGGYENPNEYDDQQGIANTSVWVPALKSQVELLSSTVRGQNGAKSYPVIGPSLVDFDPDGYSALGNIAPYIDYGNLHNYPAGENPGNTGWATSIPWFLNLLKIDSPNLPYYTTETGYTNDTAIKGLPQSVTAVYIPRLILDQWQAGFSRTYLYELVSEGGEDYGLITPTWQRKPAYTALSNMLHFLADKGHPFTPTALNYGIRGGDGNLRQLLMQRHDGTFFLALWLEESSWNVSASTPITVAPETVQIQLPAGSQYLDFSWDATGAMTQTKPTQSSPLSLTITDKIQILEVVVP